jgi:hypothetical protein
MTVEGTHVKRHAGGRPKIPIDPAEVFKLAAINCTITDMAGWFGCTEKTIDRRIRSKQRYTFSLGKLDPSGAGERSGTFAEIIEQGKAIARVSLRRKLHSQADNKPAVAIFLAKNILGYKDAGSVELTGAQGGPIQTKDVSELSDEELEAKLAQLLKEPGMADVIARATAAG